MKKILLLITILLALPLVLAQDLEISLIGYNPDTNFARVQIKNLLQEDLHNLNIQIDAFPQEPLVTLLEKENIIVYNSNIPEGMHTLKITSDELTETKDISFSLSATEKQEEYKKAQIEKRIDLQKEKLAEQKITETQKQIPYKTIIIVLITLTIIGIIIYLIKRKNE